MSAILEKLLFVPDLIFSLPKRRSAKRYAFPETVDQQCLQV
jgi:hypothetical protein